MLTVGEAGSPAGEDDRLALTHSVDLSEDMLSSVLG